MVYAVAGRASNGYSRRVLRQDYPGSKPKRVHCRLGIGRNCGRANRLGGADGGKTLARRGCEGMRACLRTHAPEGAPPGFGRTLDATKIYLHFRWLGERPDWTIREKNLTRYDHLHASARTIGPTIESLAMATVVITAYDVVNYPQGGGHFWVYLQYVLGLRLLGHDVYWLEAFRAKGREDLEAAALATFHARMEQYGLGGRYIL